jgi:hypothetical protein
MREKKNIRFVTTRWVTPKQGETLILLDEDDIFWKLKLVRGQGGEAHLVLEEEK